MVYEVYENSKRISCQILHEIFTDFGCKAIYEYKNFGYEKLGSCKEYFTEMDTREMLRIEKRYDQVIRDFF